ncbi:MAG: pyridoxal phosphate-dependent aminotransferase, partial [Deltaproteobacteria bacterium]
MFSRRIPWSLAPNALTTALEAHRTSGRTLLDLTASNPTEAALKYPREAVRTALSDEAALRYEPSPSGLPRAREAVARYYREALDTDVDPARVVLTASTSEAYAFLFKLLCDPGERILVPAPGYPLFDLLAALESVAVDRYPLGYDGRWHYDPHALEQAVTPATRAVLCVHPNNPTGSFVKFAEIGAIAAVCARHGLAVISDEVFADYAFGPDPARVPT